MVSMVAVAALSFSVSSCSSDDDSGSFNCEEAGEEAIAAFTAFLADPSEENCNAYKAALQAGLDNGCAETDEDRDDLQEEIDDLNCDNVAAVGACQTCAEYTIQGTTVPETEVCEGSNGNAFVQNIDLMVDFDDYIALQETFTTCD